ncbi:Na+/H+ antiporter subunit E [Micromonospora tulbaghiae]|uniref:Multisubunit sodium/proton antiporter, MrpE subunit n=1 Tax=Micromonospora tulbaghiae TaxID=479978 RepID=A0ABY0KR81_9ACTN|nr:Na+/H+ antiporter subunit E [Micromonospora tulbaghiae]SCF02308.1 multisubunit sodium/proton antiporter, MrpE subunit [Micromonospora tulbaghiae]
MTSQPKAPLTRRDRWRNRAIAVTGLVTVWVLLWGTFSWANVLSGLVVAAVLLVVFPLPPVTFAGRIRPVPLLRFVVRFLYDLVVASAQVAWLAVRSKHPQSAIIAVPLRVNTDLNLTLNAEALSLVPGSLILEADRSTGTLYVHVIGIRSLDEVERFRSGVLELEERIVAAVGSAEELSLVRRSVPTGPSGSVDLEGAPT